MSVGTICSKLEGLRFLKGAACSVPTLGQVTVIELWAKWCGPCRQVFPHLTSIFEARNDKGLVVVGISIEDDPTLDSFVQKEGSRMGYTVAVDTQGGTQRLMQEAGVSGIPHAFVCDREGRIAHSGHPAKPDFTHAIDKALASPAQPEKKALPLVTASLDELRAMPVKQLKQLLTERHLPIAGLSEKQDLVEAVDKQCRTVTYYG